MGSLFQSLAISERRLPWSGSSSGFCTTPIRWPPGRESPAIRCPSRCDGREHVFADSFAHGRVFQALDHFCVAAIVSPGWNEGGESVEPGRVGVGIGGDVGAGSAGGVDLGDNFGHASPVVFAGGLKVPDLDGNVGFAADAQGFVDGFEHGVAFVAHVGGVDAAELAASAARAISSSVLA